MQPARGERRKEKNWQLRDSKPGRLAVAAITTVLRATTATNPSQFSFHIAPVVYTANCSLATVRPHNCVDLLPMLFSG